MHSANTHSASRATSSGKAAARPFPNTASAIRRIVRRPQPQYDPACTANHFGPYSRFEVGSMGNRS
jgi:hypothetical protein